MKKFECVGLYDTVEQVASIGQVRGYIDEDTIGGTFGDYFYYFDSYDQEGNLESFEIFGKQDLVKKIYQIYSEGGYIDLNTLGASGGRRNFIWFEASVPEISEEEQESLEELEINEPSDEEQEEEVVELLTASVSALKLIKLNNITLEDVAKFTNKTKINKPDVIAFLES